MPSAAITPDARRYAMRACFDIHDADIHDMPRADYALAPPYARVRDDVDVATPLMIATCFADYRYHTDLIRLPTCYV